MPLFDQLIAHIREIVTLNDSEAALVVKRFRRRDLRRKEVLLQNGEISSHMRYIAKGCLRAYYLDDKAQEHVVQLGIENWWINDLYSYLTQTPARYTVQAIEATTVLQIHRDAMELLFREVPAVERFFRLKIESAYVALQEHNLNLNSKTAAERFLEFRRRYRNLEQRVPQYMIASYLGITPEFLSSIRQKLSAGHFS